MGRGKPVGRGTGSWKEKASSYVKVAEHKLQIDRPKIKKIKMSNHIISEMNIPPTLDDVIVSNEKGIPVTFGMAPVSFKENEIEIVL